MPELKRTTPCWDCPFRRNAAKGWLGADTPAGFIAKTLRDQHMPCHVDIDYKDKDWVNTQFPTAAYCAGSLIFLNNYLKYPRDRVLAEAMDGVGTSPKVFATPEEFTLHHGDEALDEMQAVMRHLQEQDDEEKSDARRT